MSFGDWLTAHVIVPFLGFGERDSGLLDFLCQHEAVSLGIGGGWELGGQIEAGVAALDERGQPSGLLAQGDCLIGKDKGVAKANRELRSADQSRNHYRKRDRIRGIPPAALMRTE